MCYIGRDSNGLHSRQISACELTNLPQFLRFDRVYFHYLTISKAISNGYPNDNVPIAKTCQFVVNYLQQLKLNDSNLIHFIVAIEKNNRSYFSDHSQLLDHLRNEFMPICGSSRGYKFEIYLVSDEVSHTNIIAQILQMPRIDCCSNVEINLPIFAILPMQLPIETISIWLHQNCDRIDEKPKERFLRIYSNSNLHIPNVQELCDHLKKVTLE